MIKNVIFDLGGVMIDFDFARFMEGFGIKGRKNDRMMDVLFEHGVWRSIDKGTLKFAEACRAAIEIAPDLEPEFRLIFEHVNESFPLMPYAQAFLLAVKEAGYRVYILSNYGEEGFNYVKERYELFKHVDGMVISYQIHGLKPHDEMYQAILKKYSLDPEECLFIDDKPENIEGARSNGIEGIVAGTTEDVMESFMKITGKEFLDIRNEDGSLTGRIKERTLVHQDGDIHGTTHLWIVRRAGERDQREENENNTARETCETGRIEVLLQKRSSNKDSHPGCYDTSSAGHIPAGCDYRGSAVRELKEELGITAGPSDLIEITDRAGVFVHHHAHKEENFGGRVFDNFEVCKAYLYTKPVDIKDITVQESEVESVRWFDIDEVIERSEAEEPGFCILADEIKYVKERALQAL
ncbi:MAG: HAD-IA family hydrolase [Lachnospiraceae bacterium]|jgi:HAD superfamily hydrolase (TIGR01509 family)|nr:HAD-IA family hydrolase [Lachnospiraceae bacterium]MEE3460659.1 HAD-IA family hydrolase [Lachnospiraceae bacterium]